jgi:DNA-binding transcriptional LysR family regulator
MDRLETRELEYFTAVAEELHFSRAAETLGIAQPGLSRAVARLERRLGVKLLERTSRRVELTEAGATFLAECRTLLAGLDGAVLRTRRAAQSSQLALAVRPGAGNGLLAELLRRHEGPEPELLFTYDSTGAVRNGLADAALVCLESDNLTGLRHAAMTREDPVALMDRDRSAARQDGVLLAEVEKLPGYRAHCPAVGLDEIQDLVALGRLVTVVGSSTATRLAPEVTAVPVLDMPPTTLALCWTPDNERPALHSFLRTSLAGPGYDGRTAQYQPHPHDRRRQGGPHSGEAPLKTLTAAETARRSAPPS